MKQTSLLLMGAAVALAAALPAQAQFKVVGPDGTVTYTDRPPTAGGAERVGPATGSNAPASNDSAWLQSLPLALRETATRFPVTLYAAVECNPCDRARTMLRQRGIPFRERLASTEADRDAWPRVVGSPDAPALTVGGQFLRGFEPQGWNQTLDLAGYPRDSRLPAGYRPPAPTPLTQPRAAQPASTPTPPAQPLAEPSLAPASGIRF